MCRSRSACLPKLAPNWFVHRALLHRWLACQTHNLRFCDVTWYSSIATFRLRRIRRPDIHEHPGDGCVARPRPLRRESNDLRLLLHPSSLRFFALLTKAFFESHNAKHSAATDSVTVTCTYVQPPSALHRTHTLDSSRQAVDTTTNTVLGSVGRSVGRSVGHSRSLSVRHGVTEVTDDGRQ